MIKLLAQLKTSQGKNIVLELTNGRIISGKVLSVDQEIVRLETDNGVGSMHSDNILIIWEPMKRSLSGENMEVFAQKLRDTVKTETAYPGAPSYGTAGPMGSDPQAEIACVSFPGFTCSQRYICRPPDTCTFTFACPGSYVPGTPSGGGGCPVFFCGPFQFGQPCRPFVFGCGPFQFGQPCGPFQFGGCGPFQFGQPCGPFQFGQPCGPFQFGGSQCIRPGGFACPGQQFIGIAPGGAANNSPVKPAGNE